MIKQAVINKMSSFYPTISIYEEETEQGFQQPSFYIKTLAGSQKKEISTRYIRKQSFGIDYFGSSGQECEAKALEMYEILEHTDVGHGRNMHYEISDKVLHFFVEYSIRLEKETEQQLQMNSLEVNKNAKEQI